MKIEFTGRGVDITDRIRNFTESKFDRLKKHLDAINDVSVVLSVEKYRHRVEIKFSSQKQSFHGHEETNDMFQAIDRVIDKLESQVRKYKQKKNDGKRRGSESIRHADVADSDTTGHEEDLRVIRDSREVSPMSLEAAIEELDNTEEGFVMYRDLETNTVSLVFKRADGHIGLIEA